MRNAIVNAALEMVETPFHHQGRVPHVGLDCAGLVVCACKEVGINLPDISNYPEIPDGSFIAMVERLCDPVPYADMQPGDFLMFRFEKEPQHIAIYLGEDQMIHTYSHVGKVVINGIDDYWMRRLTGCYSLKDETWRL